MTVLSWFDENPARQLAILSAVLAIISAIILRGIVRREALEHDVRSDWGWGLAILVLLAAGRWPSLFVTRQLNPDESVVIAGAMTLQHDPFFWRSVFGMTTGPLDFYLLIPALTACGADGYFAARFTGLALLTGALLFAHQALAANFGRMVARVCSFGAICFEALSPHPDFLHYSTELLPIFLLSTSFYLSFVPSKNSGDRTPRKNFLIGLLLGAVPFAKLQAAPIAAVGGLGLLIYELVQFGRRVPVASRRIIALIAGALVPTIIFGAALPFTTDWRGALTSYVSANVSYTQNGFGSISETMAKLQTSISSPDSLFGAWIIGISFICLAALPSLRGASSRSRNFVVGALVFLAVSLACILAPRRPFLHYLQLSVIPLILTMGGIMGIAALRVAKGHRMAWRLMLGAAFALPLFSIFLVWRFVPAPDVGRLSLFQRHPAGAVARVIRLYTSRGESLAVWGWSASYYVEAELRQATRHATTEAEIMINPYSAYFRRSYLDDFSRSMPPVFVDGSYVPEKFPNREIAHEISFPEFGALIKVNYELVDTINDVRVYVRRDRLANVRNRAEGPAAAKPE